MRQVDSIESISINLLSFFTPHLLEEYTCTQDLDRLEVIFKRIEPFFEYENKQLSYREFRYVNVSIKLLFSLSIYDKEDKYRKEQYINRYKNIAVSKYDNIGFSLKDDNSLELIPLIEADIEYVKNNLWNFSVFNNSLSNYGKALSNCFDEFLNIYFTKVLESYPPSDSDFYLYMMKSTLIDHGYYEIPKEMEYQIERIKFVSMEYSKSKNYYSNLRLEIKIIEKEIQTTYISITIDFLTFTKYYIKLGNIVKISEREEYKNTLESIINYMFVKEYSRISLENIE